jgi:hypothetical protein
MRGERPRKASSPPGVPGVVSPSDRLLAHAAAVNQGPYHSFHFHLNSSTFEVSSWESLRLAWEGQNHSCEGLQ